MLPRLNDGCGGNEGVHLSAKKKTVHKLVLRLVRLFFYSFLSYKRINENNNAIPYRE
jgi:hypothetical protein